MNDLIQTIQVLDEEELKIVNSYIDTLIFYDNTVFDSNGKSRIDTTVRSSLGASMSEEHTADTSFNIDAKHYTVTWFNPFSNANYTPSVTVLDNLTASGYSSGMVLFDVADIQAGSFKVQFKTTTKNPGPQDLGYVRAFSASATAPFSISKYGGVDDPSFTGTGQVITVGGSGTRYYLVTGVNQDGTQYTTTNQNYFLCLGNTVLQFQNNTIAYPGIPKNKNLFVKNSGNWNPSRNIFVKHENSWRQCEKVWVKSGNVWKESYVRNSSDWVNMLEGFDDTLDFAVQVVAQN